MANKIISKLLGSKRYIGSGKILEAGPDCVKWEGDEPLHPDQITHLTIGGKKCPVVKAFKTEVKEVSWERGDTRGGLEQVTIPAHTKYTLFFRTPQGLILEYTDRPGLVGKIVPVV
jgi:hypothetical protein